MDAKLFANDKIDDDKLWVSLWLEKMIWSGSKKKARNIIQIKNAPWFSMQFEAVLSDRKLIFLSAFHRHQSK